MISVLLIFDWHFDDCIINFSNIVDRYFHLGQFQIDQFDSFFIVIYRCRLFVKSWNWRCIQAIIGINYCLVYWLLDWNLSKILELFRNIIGQIYWIIIQRYISKLLFLFNFILFLNFLLEVICIYCHLWIYILSS